MSDAYGKGIVRGQVENTNLRAYSRDTDVTSAESIKTCQTVNFFGNKYVDVIQRLNDKVKSDRNIILTELDMRSKQYREVSFPEVATLYGERPRDERVWYLSPYGFRSEWKVNMLSYPQSLKPGNHRRRHAEITEAGRAKLKGNNKHHQDSELLPGIDYCVKKEPDTCWLPFPDIPSTQHFRRTWILEKRRLPVAS